MYNILDSITKKIKLWFVQPTDEKINKQTQEIAQAYSRLPVTSTKQIIKPKQFPAKRKQKEIKISVER
jgi:hypothetical protein